MKECEKDLSEEEGFEREGMVGFENGSERLRIDDFRVCMVGSRYSAGSLVLCVERSLVRMSSACRGELGRARSWVCLPSTSSFFYFFIFLHTLYLKGLLASSNASVTCKKKKCIM